MNISLPADLKKQIDAVVRNGKYATRSEFIRQLLRAWEAGELLKELKESQREASLGKAKRLRSLRDLR